MTVDDDPREAELEDFERRLSALGAEATPESEHALIALVNDLSVTQIPFDEQALANSTRFVEWLLEQRLKDWNTDRHGPEDRSFSKVVASGRPDLEDLGRSSLAGEPVDQWVILANNSGHGWLIWDRSRAPALRIMEGDDREYRVVTRTWESVYTFVREFVLPRMIGERYDALDDESGVLPRSVPLPSLTTPSFSPPASRSHVANVLETGCCLSPFIIILLLILGSIAFPILTALLSD